MILTRRLNRKGLKTKSGRKFTKNSFYDILTQEKYIGIFRWNKRKAKDSKGHHNNHAYKPEDEQIVIPGGCPAIIPLEQFQKVQEKLLERRQGKADTKSRHHYMFSGLKIMKCANCGEYMVGKVTQSHGRKYISYACPRHRGGGCPTKDIPATNLERYVCASIVGNLITEGTISSLNILAVENKPETEQINSRLISVDKKIDNIVKNLKQMESSRLRDELSQLELKKSDLERQKKDAETAVPVITAKNLKQLKNGLFEIFIANSSALNGKTTKSRRNALEVREALQTYVQEILVSNDDVKITLQL